MNIKVRELTSCFIKGIAAGIFIGIGAAAFLACDNKYVGSFLFSLGLLSVCFYKLNLYTGKIGTLIEHKLSYVADLFVMLLGNAIAISLLGVLLHYTRNEAIVMKAYELSQVKIDDSVLSLLILSSMCGVMMYLAIDGFRRNENILVKIIFVVMSIMIFILGGFEHVIANFFYYSIGFAWSIKAVWSICIVFLGNTFGSIALALILKYARTLFQTTSSIK